ncbi:hypothetical protein SAMN05421739_10247 [Pontibacter chinhatensis]|uniref:Uncharacterized protein n=1 Tax=Pontibacter chinhatensis TaxID=1436961 RepID=A0A1I2QL90_9BACT|nr:hypothetical protein SAMN05421739_10247 [Pontibacter chinhatensis]
MALKLSLGVNLKALYLELLWVPSSLLLFPSQWKLECLRQKLMQNYMKNNYYLERIMKREQERVMRTVSN